MEVAEARNVRVSDEEPPLKKPKLSIVVVEQSANDASAYPTIKQATVTPPSVVPPSRSSKLCPNLVGDRYLVQELIDGSTVNRCTDIITKEELVCKVVSGREAAQLVRAHCRLDGDHHVNSVRQVVASRGATYLVFPAAHGDLHSYVRCRKRLREPEARRLFRQMAEAVRECHEKGVVLRDIKLRKFVFADAQRTQLKLETLEDAVVLDDPEDDTLHDKRGCPAYVSPEILRTHAHYSGRAADMWSLGVILFTMLVGRYPFNDNEHTSLFLKISRGNYTIPDNLSPRAKCLIRALLRREPSERMTADDVLYHPWLVREEENDPTSYRGDQLVPVFPATPKTSRTHPVSLNEHK